MSAEYEIVGVDVGRVNDVAGFDLRLLDCFCVFHAEKISNVLAVQGHEFLYSVHYGKKKDLQRSDAGGTPVRSAGMRWRDGGRS